ncbi:hypothetical protein F751_6826 [Auxenochlorella protothecoides]|uniref:Tyrosine specific protein phosphatases domain-containing protein n=1 Tax=Auxenochlorella protothecoides TaxID=3075 RepID=A0A087SDQ4_AUXPR|nr:hypothetical protein F751_6826 [Auxenochlorella protothecoides]KFM23858.1 hypothetical protein F751_6826 [Auxenochlorella protothecoides]RMZ54794.1 hypothetical protein APUTEX25_000311 [Auxenochlorella protothecoides]|eukprot:RMZ54794.1 hypothetical protein APUTEX25_000311 [Auxenochlorella protothecoides]
MDLGLPSLPAMPGPEYRGPTPWSNWVIRPRLIAGAYPAGQDDGETDRILTTLLELGVTTFVCLQAEFSLHTSENLWRTGQEKLDFLHLPILDGNVTTDTAMSRLVDDCCLRLLRGERLYVHCWGGHGRTGTVIATMLGRLYHLPVATALRYTQAFHDTRRYPQGVRSPQTPVQIAQRFQYLAAIPWSLDPGQIVETHILCPPPLRPRLRSRSLLCATWHRLVP